MPTTVEVYRVESDETTGAFLGFGSLLDPSVVFLHPAAVEPEPDGPVEPGPIRPGPIRPGPIRPGPVRPGPFRPDFPLEPRIAQPLHDEPAAAPAGPGAPQARARCRIRTDTSLLTLDGVILPAPTDVSVAAPTAIQLDIMFAGDIDVIDVPQGPGHPTADEAADAVMAFVTEAALSDPPAPATPPPAGPDVDDHRPHPGRRPWYCVICPGAFGC